MATWNVYTPQYKIIKKLPDSLENFDQDEEFSNEKEAKYELGHHQFSGSKKKKSSLLNISNDILDIFDKAGNSESSDEESQAEYNPGVLQKTDSQ